MKVTWFVVLCLFVLAVVVGVNAAELKPQTVEAFDLYVRVTEARMKTELDGEAPFLWIDRLWDDQREQAYQQLRAGAVVIEKLETQNEGDTIDIPSGKVHHWVGTVLIPNVTLEQTIAMVQDYDRYAEIFAPHVRRSEIRERDGNRFKVYAQLYEKKVVTWVANTEYDAEFIFLDAARVHVLSYTTRIAEIEHPDTPEEQEKPEGNDRGYMWRFYNYCSFEERDADTYMQCESIALSLRIPFFFNMFVGRFVDGFSKDKMTFSLEATRSHLTRNEVPLD